ncbi:MAG: hypothetical protein ABIA04_16000 [Pseudomonadota bacterium]
MLTRKYSQGSGLDNVRFHSTDINSQRLSTERQEATIDELESKKRPTPNDPGEAKKNSCLNIF